MNKILVTIQGRTLILYYQVKRCLAHKGAIPASYIVVSPSAELARFNLKGLTPEMFCMNIADMVNFRRLFSGQVENERQLAVAHWDMNHEAYLQVIHAMPANLTHQELVHLLAPLPSYIRESDGQYIDFEEDIVRQEAGESTRFSGYRLSIVTENIEGDISSSAYYHLGTRSQEGWQDTLPPTADFEPVQNAVQNKIQAIRDAGVQLTRICDETDYALTGRN